MCIRDRLDSPTPGENSQLCSNHFTISLVGPLSYPRGKPMTCALDDMSTNISVDCRGAQNTHDPLLLWFGYCLMISWLFRSFISRYRSLTGSRSYTEDQLRLVWIKHNVLYFTVSWKGFTATDLHVQSANNIQGFLKGLTLLAGYSTVDTKYNTCNACLLYTSPSPRDA